jgi:hypothetical protein
MQIPKTPLRGLLAKQNRVGYAWVDIIVQVYSHPFNSHYSKHPSNCQATPLFYAQNAAFFRSEPLLASNPIRLQPFWRFKRLRRANL